jgi:translation initiation factor IF-2
MFVVAGRAFTPVRFIENFRGERIAQATFSSPVLIRGFSLVPETGAAFITVTSKKEAEKILAEGEVVPKSTTAHDAGGKLQVPIILKADVLGTIDALLHELAKYTHDRSSLRVLTAAVGPVSENDVKNAIASNALILGFNVKVEGNARDLADRNGIPIETFSIIYELSKRAEEILKERTPRIKVEETIAEAKILRIFSQNGAKQVIGARTITGALPLGAQVKILRREIEIGRGKVTNLQLQRANVQSVPPETEFGAQVDARVEAAPGDVLVAFHVVESA